MFARAPFLRFNANNDFLIGLNCFQPFGYGYPFSNGGNDATVMPDLRLAALHSVGFNFLRMVVDPEPLLAADSASNVTTTQLDARIAEVIAGAARRVAFGFKVIVDMHFHGYLQSFSAGWQFTDVFDSGTKRDRLSFVTGRLCAAIHANRATLPSSEVAYELFNEPPGPNDGISAATANTHQLVWAAAARAAMPMHTILVGGSNYNAYDSVQAGSTSGLTAMTASQWDANVGFVVHDYEGIFPLQDSAGTIYQYAHGVRYPAGTGTTEQAEKNAFTAAAGGDSNAINSVVTQDGWASSLHQYYVTFGTKALRATRLAVPCAWADAAGISRRRIFMTESGVNFTGSTDAPSADAALWIQHLKENAQTAGISCICVHQMQGPDGFGIQDSSSPWALDAGIQAALFG